jgi:membrane protease YdiL (CAAX protease family)
MDNIEEKGEVFSYRSFAYKKTAIIIILYIAVGAIASLIGSYLINKEFSKDFNVFTQGLVQLTCMLLPIFYLSRRSLLPFNVIFRIKTVPSQRQIIYGLLGILSFQILASGYSILQDYFFLRTNFFPEIIIKLYRELQSAVDKMYLEILGGTGYYQLVRAILIGALIPAISEESLFRGFLQRHLEQEISPVKAIFVTALIFSLLHMSPTGFIPLLGIGIYLGFLAYMTDSLLVPVLAHFFNNLASVFIIYSPKLSEIETKSDNLPFISGLSIFFVGLILTIIFSYLIYQNSSKSLRKRHSVEVTDVSSEQDYRGT